MRCIRVTMENKERYDIPMSVIEKDMSENEMWYDERGFEQQVDWLENNMNWNDVKDQALLVDDHIEVDCADGLANGHKEYVERPVRAHAYGAGVQSIAILYKYINGEIEKPDVVIFADTQAEPEDVYEKVARDKKVCEDNGIRFEIVTYKNLLKPDGKGLFLPLYTMSKHGRAGTYKRQCTDRFKIAPMRSFLRKVMKAKKIEMWLGISTDEAGRIKPSRVKYAVNRYPLIEMDISRDDCTDYLKKIGVEASKSACVMCPYRNKMGWKAIRKNENDWNKAKEYDDMIRMRNKNKNVRMYIHKDRTPLEFAVDGDKTQTNLFINECEGYCGL